MGPLILFRCIGIDDTACSRTVGERYNSVWRRADGDASHNVSEYRDITVAGIGFFSGHVARFFRVWARSAGTGLHRSTNATCNRRHGRSERSVIASQEPPGWLTAIDQALERLVGVAGANAIYSSSRRKRWSKIPWTTSVLFAWYIVLKYCIFDSALK